MFNNTNSISNSSVNNTLNINAVNGTIIKSYPKSFFEKFNLNSQFAKEVLNASPFIETGISKNHEEPIVVLQMMICGDMEVIAEIMFKKDFDEIFKNEKD